MLKSFSVLIFAVALAMSACSGEEQEHVTAVENGGDVAAGIIAAVGDSLTAGFGLDEEESYPYLLQQKLEEDGYNYKVVNAGMSAETSSGTLSRIDWILTLDPDIIILETGANDGLRGIDPKVVKTNIGEILQKLEQAGVTVLLAGMKMVWNLGPLYVRQFNGIYPSLADQYNLEFMPFFLQDVAMKVDLNQADGIHPNAKGYQLIAENIYPYVVKVIEKRESR